MALLWGADDPFAFSFHRHFAPMGQYIIGHFFSIFIQNPTYNKYRCLILGKTVCLAHPWKATIFYLQTLCCEKKSEPELILQIIPICVPKYPLSRKNRSAKFAKGRKVRKEEKGNKTPPFFNHTNLCSINSAIPSLPGPLRHFFGIWKPSIKFVL